VAGAAATGIVYRKAAVKKKVAPQVYQAAVCIQYFCLFFAFCITQQKTI